MKFQFKQIISKAITFIKANRFLTLIGVYAFLLMTFNNNSKIRPKELTDKKTFRENEILVDKRMDYLGSEKDATLAIIKDLRSRIAQLEANNKGKDKAHDVVTALQKAKDKMLAAITQQNEIEKLGNSKIVSDSISYKSSRPKRKKYRRKLSFPVAFNNNEISIPKGSRIKATMLTGMQSGYGGREPVLIAFDKEMILPNHYEIDLTGCMALGKASGDESKERVCIEVYSLACIDNNGKSIEKDIKAFIVDDRDSTHCAIGKVNTKGHKAVYKSALAEMIAGAGRILQAGSTVTNVSPLGGVTKILSGNSAKNVIGGGVARGAQTLANWWINQANMMMPTIDVEAGRPIWIITLDSFKLPKRFLNEKEKAHEILNDSIIL